MLNKVTPAALSRAELVHSRSPRIAIVGAGPTGLLAALLIHRQGLEATVYERRAGVVEVPQAHVVNARTCEILRELGLHDLFVEAASPVAKVAAVTWRDSVAGTCFGALDISRRAKPDDDAPSPVHMLNIGQDVFSRILLDELLVAGGTVLFGHAVSAAAVEGGQAVLHVQPNNGALRREVFDYVLACDGAGSSVRDALGIGMMGPAALAKYASCYFKADLNRYFGKDTGPVHFLGGDVPGILICFDMKDSWALMCAMGPDTTRERFSQDTMLQLVRRAIGDPLVSVEMISVGSWTMSAQVATEFRRGPFFIVGDAAHRFPPTGGLGLNTGAQDAHNLAWKLGMVANRFAGEALLDTYAAERMPVAIRNCEQSAHNAVKLREVEQACGVSFMSAVDPDIVNRPAPAPRDYGISGDSSSAAVKRERVAKAIANQRVHFDAPRIELGYRYGEDQGLTIDNHEQMPGLRVGARLPHVWLEAGDRRISSIDLPYRHGYTLLIPSRDNSWEAYAAQLDRRRVSVRRVPESVLFTTDKRAVLVRPDGHVQWIGAGPSLQVFEAIDQLHSGQIQRDPPPRRVIPNNERATTMFQPQHGICPSKLAHVVLRSDQRFEAMCQWYRDLLNAAIVHQDVMTCFMTYDDEHHRLAIIRAPGAADRPAGTVGLEHFAFTFANLSDLLETFARLKEQGIHPILTINHGGTTSVYYEDPDRNRVELQVDNFDSISDFVVFLQSGAMAANPIGVAFDADEMLAKLRSGVPAKTLQAYPVPPSPVDPKVIERLNRN